MTSIYLSSEQFARIERAVLRLETPAAAKLRAEIDVTVAPIRFMEDGTLRYGVVSKTALATATGQTKVST